MSMRIAIVASVVAGPVGAAAGQSAPRLVDGDFHTAAVIAADLDGDGRADLAAAGYYQDEIAWWRNLGDDAFERHLVHALDGATALRAVDLDGDGDLDIVAVSKVLETVHWYENRSEDAQGAAPTFVAHFVLSRAGATPLAVDAGDLDGDGHPDLLVAFAYDPLLHVVLNPQGGTALGAVVRTIAVPGNGVSAARAVDFDGDGDLDIVAATPWDWTGDLNHYWFRNDGTGSFGAVQPIGGGLPWQGAFAFDVADMNGDGRLDVVAMSDWQQGNTTVHWYERLDAEGMLWSAPHVIDATFAGCAGTQSLCACDLDGDGRTDVLAGSSFVAPRLCAWLERGGTFVPVELAAGFPAHGVTAADLDGDGCPEAIAGSWAPMFTGKVQWWNLACSACPTDLDADAQTAGTDLSLLMAQWGGPGLGDLDHDGTVGWPDLLRLIAAWGPCGAEQP